MSGFKSIDSGSVSNVIDSISGMSGNGKNVIDSISGITLPETAASVLTIAAVILSVILLVKILASPVKKIFKLALNTLLGMGILFVINLIGKSFGIQLDINVTQCAIAAVFGVPGVLLMVLIKLFL